MCGEAGISICDDFATSIPIQNTEISHQRFGDVSRHNLTLKQDAWHSGADAITPPDASKARLG